MKKILVCGLARSGQAAARVLMQSGARVTAMDSRNEIIWEYSPEGIEVRLGVDPLDFVHEFELVIISPGITVYAPFVQKALELGISVWGETELAYRLCPCPMIAITGTNGKTTVTTLVGEIMKLANSKTIVAGNIGIPLSSLVTSLDESSLVVAEVSSFQLETISAFRPTISAILNITEDHLDRHGDMETYIDAKKKIYKNQRQYDKIVLNYDNSITKSLRPPCEVVYFSKNNKLSEGVWVEDGVIVAKIPEICERTEIMPLSDTKVLGENALAATAIALCGGAGFEQIRKILLNFTGVAHRLEFVGEYDDILFYNDSKATNTDAAIKALESFDEPVVLIAGGYDKQADFTDWVRLFEDRVSYLVLTGQTAQKIAGCCDDIGFTRYEIVNNLRTAVSVARNFAVKAVLFSPACASFDDFTSFEERGEFYRQYIKEG